MGLKHTISGLILFVLFGVILALASQWFTKNRKGLYSRVINTHGSIHSVCSDKGADIDKFASVDFTATPQEYLHYYFFSIENAKEYLNGSDAHVVEKGPYALRKFSTKFNISFKKSSLTTGTDPKSAISYDIANSYVALDRETLIVSTMRRSVDDLSLSWSTVDDVETEPIRMPAHLSMSDPVTNLSPSYLKFLGDVNDETNMVLRFVCTAQQVSNIVTATGGTADKAQCTSSEINDPSVDCACCMLDHVHATLTSQNGASPAYNSCHTYFDDAGATMSTLSLLATYDGGVAVKDSTHDKFDGSGTKFSATKHGQTEYHTPLIQSHSVNDLMFGYPSAFLGRYMATSVMGEAVNVAASTLTRTQVATSVLKGEMDASLSQKIGNVAEYTKAVGAVCSSTCTASTDPNLATSALGHMCSGTSAPRHSTSTASEISMGGIDCKPYSSTFATKLYCTTIQNTLLLAPNTAGYEACTCADGTDDWSSTGCCLAGGQQAGDDLTGMGCLHPVAGLVDSNYAGKEASSDKIDVGKAVETWMAEMPTDNRVTKFMCPVETKNFDITDDSEHNFFSYYEEVGAASQAVTYLSTGNYRMRQGDASDPNAVAYTSNITGTSGDMILGTGLTSLPQDIAISNGRTIPSFPVLNHMTKLPFQFKHNPKLHAKSCGTNDLCIKAARFLMLEDNFIHNDPNTTAPNGRGLPYNGLQPFGHIAGVPTYLHQPFFMNGDAQLYTQTDNTHVNATKGNGIDLFASGSYADFTQATIDFADVGAGEDPGAFSTTNKKYHPVTANWTAAHKATFESYLDVEAATGLVLNSKIATGVSYSVWECDPTTNAHCKKAVHTTSSATTCYSTAGTADYTALDTSAKSTLDSLSRNTFSYPCSAANLVTPKMVGGKILPMYWSDTLRDARLADVNLLNAYAYGNAQVHLVWMYLLGVATIILNIAFVLTCCVTKEGMFTMAGSW